MKKISVLIKASFIIILFCIASIVSASPDSMAPVLKKVMPAVVNVNVEAEIALPPGLINELQRQRVPGSPSIPTVRKYEKLGSGVIVDAKKGYILTNAHVVKDAKKITVNLSDGRKEVAKLIGFDKASDVAVLQIHTDELHAITLGNSNKLEVGDFVVAIGNPFGLQQTVTSGIVSALQRNDLNIEGYENFIQTDAAINPGNSGGALINVRGHLIGINTAIISTSGSNSGIGFAIPINMAKSIMEQLIKYGSVKRGVLGLFGQPLTPELSKAFNLKPRKGVVITAINPNSAAQLAGLKVNDIITKINGEDISNVFQLRNVIGLVRADQDITADYLRKGKARQTTVKLTSSEQQLKQAQVTFPYFYGVSLQSFNGTTTSQVPIHGIKILSLAESSNAWSAGLRVNDIIVQANQKEVKTVKQLNQIAHAAKKSLLLNVRRGPGAFFIVLKPQKL